MQKITPFLWFDDQAEEAANFYTAIFNPLKNEPMRHAEEDQPGAKEKVMSKTFQLEGLEFIALNGGPQFTFTPAISLFVSCRTEEEIDRLFEQLSEGGGILMPLGSYPFSKKFGWITDPFGVSWQLNFAGSASRTQMIMPSLMYVGEQSGKAKEAMNFYRAQFENSELIEIACYDAGQPEPEGTVKQALFTLNGQDFRVMDSNLAHAFTFTPALSFFVRCETQEEVDRLWANLSEGGKTQQCGWLQDKYGVSWQIIPSILGELLSDENEEKSENVMQAMLQMEKIDIQGLKQAYERPDSDMTALT